MKHRILTVILLLAFASGVVAQEPPVIQANAPRSIHSPLVNDIAITAGASSLYGWLYINIRGDRYMSYPYRTSISRYGNYGIQYHRNFKWWLQYGVKSTVEIGQFYRYNDNGLSIAGYRNNLIWTLMPSIRFTYINRDWVRLYSGMDVGVAIAYSHDNLYAPGHKGSTIHDEFAINFTPIGVNVGRKLYGMFEFNLGATSFVRFGLGYRF